MKKIIFIISLAIIILTSCSTRYPIESKPIYTGNVNFNRNIKIESVSGDVIITRNGTKVDYNNERIFPNDIIKTGLNGSCKIIIGDINSVILDENTQIQILFQGDNNRRILIQLINGKIFCTLDMHLENLQSVTVAVDAILFQSIFKGSFGVAKDTIPNFTLAEGYCFDSMQIMCFNGNDTLVNDAEAGEYITVREGLMPFVNKMKDENVSEFFKKLIGKYDYDR